MQLEHSTRVDKNKKLNEQQGYSSYCRKCELSDKCSKKNKIYQLQSTIEASKLHKMMEKNRVSFSVKDYMALPFKTYQLKLMLEEVVDNFSYQKQG